ncbi:PAS domain S-box protein [Candidatus Magnetominusculus xianensis]|uniref:histidine kinase n=1 Tax=Candidatus Magnetominusculus xianensis TaxID=1748249 RepID=A0ABR5SI46_9BACT|nr:PAS domain S-box protein [Candidatus Magnetominusculus xianensis]KWT83474.1 PAS domain-containing sensor histidine kinase [Candidatus Magnetominusculus xianensis]MBF0404114.1 PAS domain S-box protein [Nitrospirota bacterium]
MFSDELDDKIKSIKNKLSFVDNLRKSLKDRVESNITSLFESNIVLQERVFQRTLELDNTNKKLQSEITERNQVEEALRQSENRYKRLVGAITDYMHTVEVQDGMAVSTSHAPGCIGVTGYSSEEFERDAYLWYRMIHEDDRHFVGSVAQRVLSGETVPPIEHRIWHKDGSIRWIRNTIVPRHDKDGQLIAYDGLISDITERKLADNALRQSETRYRRLLDAITDYIYTVDVKDGVPVSTTHGPGCVAVTGYTPEEFAENSFLWLSMVPNEDKNAVVRLGKKVLYGGIFQAVEHRIIHKDGHIKWVRNTPVPRYESDGRLVAYDGLITDITERKLAEEEVRKNKEQLQDFFDNAHDMIQIVNTGGKFIYVNRSWQNTLGYSNEEVSTLTLADIIHPDDRDRCLGLFDMVLGGGSISNIEMMFVNKNGSPIAVIGSVNCSYEDTGQAVARGIFHDFSEIKKAKESLEKINDLLELRVKERTGELLHANTYLETVLSSLTDALLVAGPDNIIKTINQTAYQLLGYSEGELVGKSVVEIFEDNIIEYILEAQRNGSAKDVLMNMKTKQAVSIPILANLSRLGNIGNETILAAHDMRELKKLEEETKRIQVKMLTSSKMATLGEISTGIAHEINQPLTYISSFIQGLLFDIKKDCFNIDDTENDSRTAYKQVARIVDIIQHLRTFGRRDDIEMRLINIETAIDNTMLLMGERIRLSNITLIREIDTDIPNFMGNANQLEQVFINLLQNAIDAFPPRKEDAVIRITARHSVRKKSIILKFYDNGSGINKDIIDKIFEPFYTTKEVGKGTGLGLSIVYGIISEHNGTILCDSTVGKGTVFTITIPVGGTVGKR